MNASRRARAYERSLGPRARTAHGVFYTRDDVADLLVRGGVALWLDLRTGVPFQAAMDALESGRHLPEMHALAGAVIVDPSCGAGALLAAARRALAGTHVRLVGADIDPCAVALARARLGAEAELWVEDALAATGPKGDLVLTNPPYGVERGSPDVDRYVTFWRAAAARAKPGGVLAVLAPISWRTGPRFERARREVILASGVRRIIELPRGTFLDAYINPCITLCAPRSISTATATATATPTLTGTATPTRTATPFLCDLFSSARGILAPTPPSARGLPLLLGPLAPFAWPDQPAAFASVEPRNVKEGRRALSFVSGPRLLVRRIVGRARRLTCVVALAPAVVKKDYYVLAPREPGLSLRAYTALLHARPMADRIAAEDAAATKSEFAQLTLTRLRALCVPRLPAPTEAERARIGAVRDEAVDVRDPRLASAWLEARAVEAEAIGREMLVTQARQVESDPRWDLLRRRLDLFVGRMLGAPPSNY